MLAHFFTACNFWYHLKSLTIPEAIRHPTRQMQEHRVTNTHFATAPSAYGCSCRMCDFLGWMVLLKKTAPIKFLCWCLLWFAKRRDLVAFWRCKHTRRDGCVRDVHVLICTRVVQIGVAVRPAKLGTAPQLRDWSWTKRSESPRPQPKAGEHSRSSYFFQ